MVFKGMLKKGCRTIQYWLHAGLTKQEYHQIAGQIYQNNCQNLIIYSAIATVFLLIMVLISLFSTAVDENRRIYISTMLITFFQFLLARFWCREHPKLLLLNMYGFINILFLFGILLGTVTSPNQESVTFIALVLTVPTLFTDKPVRMIASIFLYVVIFIGVAVWVKDPAVLAVDLINACVFGTISCIISIYLMKIKCQNILYEQQVAFMSETDILTGLKNRNCYEHRWQNYPAICRQSVSCIFLDVNGLHEVNSLQGHKAGDDMLRFVAEVTQQQFGSQDTYRIGGDEFLAFVIDGTSEEIEEKIHTILTAAKEKHYTVSIGYATASHPNIHMEDLVRIADQNMYREKEQFYLQTQGARASRT